MSETKTTKIGNFLRGLGDVGKPILQAAAGLTGQAWLSTVADNITTSKELNQEQISLALEYYKTDLLDIQNARSLQSDALKQEDLFSKRFVYYLASFWSIVGAAFIMIVLFKDIPTSNTRLVDTILGFLLGTIVSSIIAYFFGSSKGSSDKNAMMTKK